MEKDVNSYCCICGNGYHVCLSCDNNKNLNPWKIYTDTAEHYKIYQIIKGYNTDIYNKDEAKQKLSRVDLSDLSKLRDNIQKTIKEIMEVEEKIKSKTKVKSVKK